MIDLIERLILWNWAQEACFRVSTLRNIGTKYRRRVNISAQGELLTHSLLILALSPPYLDCSLGEFHGG